MTILIWVLMYVAITMLIIVFDYWWYHRKPIHLRNDKFYGKEPSYSHFKYIFGVWLITYVGLPISFVVSPFIKFYDYIKHKIENSYW